MVSEVEYSWAESAVGLRIPSPPQQGGKAIKLWCHLVVESPATQEEEYNGSYPPRAANSAISSMVQTQYKRWTQLMNVI